MGSKRKRQAQEAPAAAPAPKKHQKTKSKSAPATEVEPTIASPFVEHPKGPELKREVGLYDQLSSEDASERLAAADAVVQGLLGGDGVEEATLVRHLERRLFRGLASGRKGARLGFSVVITEVLGQLFGEGEEMEKYNGLGFERVLGILAAKTKPEGDLSGQEEKDHALGLLFGLQSFVRAKILFADEQGERWDMVFAKLMELAGKKPWLREECGYVIIEALSQMSQQIAEKTLQRIQEEGLAASPEGVGIWLSARKLFPDMKFPAKPWGNSGNPLEHLKTLAKALKESSSQEDGNQVKQTGNWNPKLHFVWGLVLAEYVKNAEENDEIEEFANFWKVAVDENLFSASASRERKFWGLLLFQKMLIDAAPFPKLLANVFSPNLVRCLINHLSQEDRFLNKAADKSLKIMLQMVEANPNTVSTILPKLISGNGFYNFDQVTKTKTIDKLLSLVDEKDAEAVVKVLLQPVLIVEVLDESKDTESRRQHFADYLLSMIRRVNISDESKGSEWVKTIALPTLANLAYSKKKLVCKPELSEKSRTLFRTRLTSAFSHLISDPKGFSYPCDLLKSLKPDAIEMDDEITEAKDKALATMEKIIKKTKKASDKEKKSLEALSLLYALVIFQLYNGEADAGSVLDELKLCYDKLIRGKGDQAEDVSQILVEILLSFLSKSSVLLRKVAEHVFTAFSGEITAEGLSLMTDILGSKESLQGQQELFDQNDDEDGHDHEHDHDDDELDSDVEMIEANGEEDDISDDEKDDDDEAEPDDDEEGAKLDAALAAALGTRRLDQDLSEEASDSDADMSDSEMMALDEKLVEIFKARKKLPNKKQEKKNAKENIVNFKNRVLDLVEIYCKKQAQNPRAFGLLLPLLMVIRETSTKQIGEKAHGVIVAFAKAFKSFKPNAEDDLDFDIAERIELLKQIHEEASKDPSNAFGKAASTASLLVASSIWKVDKRLVKKVASVYRDTQVTWVTGERRYVAAFFHDWVNWCQSHAVSE